MKYKVFFFYNLYLSLLGCSLAQEISSTFSCVIDTNVFFYNICERNITISIDNDVLKIADYFIMDSIHDNCGMFLCQELHLKTRLEYNNNYYDSIYDILGYGTYLGCDEYTNSYDMFNIKTYENNSLFIISTACKQTNKIDMIVISLGKDSIESAFFFTIPSNDYCKELIIASYDEEQHIIIEIPKKNCEDKLRFVLCKKLSLTDYESLFINNYKN